MEASCRPIIKPAVAGRIIVALLLVLGVWGTLCEALPAILRDDLFFGDAAQHTWWLYHFADSQLFPHDRTLDYYSLPVFAPFGYQAYMRGLTRLFDAQRLVEATGLALSLISLLITWRIGIALGGRAGAAAALSVFIALNFAALHDGGFPRSFAMPLFLGATLAVCRRKWPMLGLVLILIAVFYPPVVLNLAPVVAAVLLIGIVRTERLPRGFWTMTVLGLTAAVIIGAVYLRPLPDWAGRWFTYPEARAMPEWSTLGRTQFFRPWKIFYFSSSTSGIGLSFQNACLAAALLCASVLALRRALAIEAWLILGVGLLMFVLAHATLFTLYLPSRYLTYALPTFAILWAAGAGRELRHRLRRWINRPNYTHRKIMTAIGTVVVFGYAALLCSRAVAAYRGAAMWNLSADYMTALETLKAMPPDTIVAAHPDDANAIPLRARKSVLSNTETSIAFNTAYYAWAKQRIEAEFDMLYASDWTTIDTLADAFGAQVFLLDRKRLTSPDGKYFAPFAEENADRIAKASADGFAMLNPPPRRVISQNGDIVLLRIGKAAP